MRFDDLELVPFVCGGVCGDPIEDTLITSTDALYVLGAAIGHEECGLCVCDINGDADITSIDALLLLYDATGSPMPLACPPANVP